MGFDQLIRNFDHLIHRNAENFESLAEGEDGKDVYSLIAIDDSDLTIVDDSDDDGVAANGAHGSHHPPFHIGKTLALSNPIAFLRHSNGSNHD